MHKQNGKTPAYKQLLTKTEIVQMSDDLEWACINDSDRIFKAGYHARYKEDCPYPPTAQGPFVIWMQGYSQHQRDRQKVAELAERVYCHSPLVIGWAR